MDYLYMMKEHLSAIRSSFVLTKNSSDSHLQLAVYMCVHAQHCR